MGDSVPKHTGPISLTDTHLEPSVLRTRPTTTRENRRRWKGLIPRDTQAACRFNCLASNSTPFFHFFLPRHVLSRVFRGKFVDALEKSHSQLTLSGALQPLHQPPAFASFLRTLFRQDWVVYLKPPFGGPQHVLHYLAGYTHRVAISNHRLVTLSSQEFLRRFLLHVLPRGFVRIRF